MLIMNINNYNFSVLQKVSSQNTNGKDFSNRIEALVNKYRFSGKLSPAEWAELRKLSPQTYAGVKACANVKEQQEQREEQIRENIEIARKERIEEEKEEEARRNKRNRDRYV